MSDKTKIIIDQSNVNAIKNLSFKDLEASFQEFRHKLQGKLTFDSFYELSKQLDEADGILTQKGEEIKTAKGAIIALKSQLYDIEFQFYDNKNIEIVDNGYNPFESNVNPPSSSSQDKAFASDTDFPSMASDPWESYNTDTSLQPEMSNLRNDSPESFDQDFPGFSAQNAAASHQLNKLLAEMDITTRDAQSDSTSSYSQAHNPSSELVETPHSPKVRELTVSRPKEKIGYRIASQKNGYVIVRLENTPSTALSPKRLKTLMAKLNNGQTFFDAISVTRKGNIRLNLCQGFTYQDASDSGAFKIPGLVLVNSSDWFALTAHGISRYDENGREYSIKELSDVMKESGLRLARPPEWVDKNTPKGILKLSFDSQRDRDDAYFMRALYFNDDRAKFRFYPQEWYGNEFAKAHNEKFSNGAQLKRLEDNETIRFFQANCFFDLQTSHEVLFDLVHQAYYVLIQNPWNYNDGRPCERVEWKHFSEHFYHEKGGARVALYQARQYTRPVFLSSTQNPSISSYLIEGFLLIQVDRPSNHDAMEFVEALEEIFELGSGMSMILAGCINLQHSMWDGSEATSSKAADKLVEILEKNDFLRVSPRNSNFIDEDGYYNNPTLLLAQRSIYPRITISSYTPTLSDYLEAVLPDSHKIAWEIHPN